MKFTKAEKKKSKLRLGLTGPSGSGKTYSALLIAAGMGGKVAVLDTERGSASLYAGLTAFDSLELNPPFAPGRFIEAIRTAEAEGYDTLILDSITHEWNGTGGCLQLVDEIAKARFKGNSWSAWSDVTPRHQAFLDAILQCNLHIIATMRSKTETAQSNEGGKVRVSKLGMKAEQREGAEYEFTTVLDLSHDGHFAIPSKDRTGLFAGSDPFVISAETGKRLMQWLNSGADSAPAPAPAPAQSPAPAQAPAQAPAPTLASHLPTEAVINDQQHRLLEAEIRTRGLDRDRVKTWVKRKWGVTHLTELPAQYLNTLMQNIAEWAGSESNQSREQVNRHDEKTIEYYPDDKYKIDLSKYENLIRTGKKSAMQIIMMIETKYAMTAEQKNRYLDIQAELQS